MGGFGSGRHRWHKKRTTEGCLSIDATKLRQWGYLAPGTQRAGTLNWTRGGSKEPDSHVGYVLTVGDADGTLRLSYTLARAADTFDYRVQLVTTGCHFGGVRWWLVCPLVAGGVACGRRVRKLYLAGRYFGCRSCHGLTYTSTQQSDKRVYAALRARLDLDVPADLSGLSVADLGLLLKTLTHRQRRLDRLLSRYGG